MINEQEGLYTLYLRGSENGKKVDDKRVISSVANCLNPYEKADYEQDDGSCCKRRSADHCFQHN